MKRLLAIVLLLASMLLITACGGGGGNNTPGGGEDEGGANLLSVTLLVSEGATVTSENPVKVEEGGSASFTLSLENKYVIREIEGASYNAETNTVTVENVTRDTRVSVTPVKVEYDTSVKYNYFYSGFKSGDTSSYRNGVSLNAGSIITVKANNEGFAFMGWSLNNFLELGGKLACAEREFTFELTPEMTDYGNCKIFANYADLRDNTVYYHLNGGTVDPSSSNLQTDRYQTVTVTPGSASVKVVMSANYYQKVGTVSLFWNDGSFYRDGYVLKEFNTKADGTGESFDPGSLYPMKSLGPNIYCIWAEETNHSDFEYEDITISPDGVNTSYVPHWKTEGVIITNYKGDADEVVIPEIIGGKYVTAIAEGAFQNKKMETLILSRFILKVDVGAFVNCSSLETIYYPDSIRTISNDSFDTVSWGGVKNFYVAATMAPRGMYGMSDGGMYAIKLARFFANPNKNRIVIVSGSSSFQGLSGGYLEALLGDEYCVVNFGTTRTTHIYFFLPVLGYFADEDDVIIYAPENSIYEMGEPELYWKTLRDAEGMYNIFRYLDISNYTNVLGSFSDFNSGTNGSTNRYTRAPQKYAQMMDKSNDWGEYDHDDRHQYMDESHYKDYYDIRLDKYFVSKDDKGSNEVVDPADITDPKYKDVMNDVITRAKKNGAKVYYSFAPMADEAISAEAKAGGEKWLSDFEELIKANFVFDGVLGDAKNYIFNVKYFYNNAFHPNDYGRGYRTYRVYVDLCLEVLGIAGYDMKGYLDVGTDFDGTLFELDSNGIPNTPADLSEEE